MILEEDLRLEGSEEEGGGGGGEAWCLIAVIAMDD